MANNNDGSIKEVKVWPWFVLAFVFVVVCTVATPSVVSNLVKDAEVDNPGIFGDMFGALNAAFSGLALAGVVIAILLQRNELALQRYELKQTRSVLNDQKEQLEAQQKTMSRQRLEMSFFNLMGSFNSVIDSVVLSLTEEGGVQILDRIRGRECFPILAKRLFNKIQLDMAPGEQLDPPIREVVRVRYDIFFRNHEYLLGHYFRVLYNWVCFVNDSEDLDEKEKMTYIRFIRAQLSKHEVALLAANCVTDHGASFLPHIEKYSLLKHFSHIELGLDEQTAGSFKALFNDVAFGEKIEY